MRDNEMSKLRWSFLLFGGSNIYKFGSTLEVMRQWWREFGFQLFD